MPIDTGLRGRLDKKGISAEKARKTVFDPTPKDTSAAAVTGDYKRDRAIRQQGLAVRYDYLKVQRSYAPSKAMRNCSRFTIASLVQNDEQGRYLLVKAKGQKRKHYLADDSEIPAMQLRANEYGSSITGLQTCDNPNCVMCSRSKAMQRAETIDKALKLTQTRQAGRWSNYFVTLTIQRQPCARAAAKDIQKRWRAVQKALQYRYKGRRLAFSRAVDVTFRPDLIAAKQCYHVHLHCIVLIEGSAPLDELRAHVLKAWKGGGDCTIRVDEQGQDIQPIRDNEKISKYVAKMGGLGLELASSQTKKGKGRSISLPQLLQRICEGETKLRRIYAEYLDMMTGVRTMAFSRSWGDLVDEYDRLAAECSEGAEDTKDLAWRLTVPPSWWASVIQHQSVIVQAVYYYRQRLHAFEYCKLLARLFTLEPPNRSELIELWALGRLKGWHLDALSTCHH